MIVTGSQAMILELGLARNGTIRGMTSASDLESMYLLFTAGVAMLTIVVQPNMDWGDVPPQRDLRSAFRSL